MVGAHRYDDMKSAGENIELQTTILSRFDLIFIVKDERNADRDRQIAKCAPALPLCEHTGCSACRLHPLPGKASIASG